MVVRLPDEEVAFDNHDRIDFTSHMHIKKMVHRFKEVRFRDNCLEGYERSYVQ